MKTKIYIPTEDRANYTTSFYNKNNEIIYLKEIELDIPTDEEISNESLKITGRATESDWKYKRNGFVEGAKYLREQITNQLKNK